MTKKVTLFDTTLRDGEQGEGIAFTVEDKLKIALLLDAAGIDYIEGGWPGSNPKAIDFFKKIAKVKLKSAKMVAFGSTCRKGKPAREDHNLKMLVAAKTPAVAIFGKCWGLHVKDALGISNAENIKLVKDSIKFLKSKKKEVIFDAEHFFDGYKSNKKYAIDVCKAAIEAGVDLISLCDTNGGSLPFEIETIVNDLRKEIDIPLAIHAHNDAGTAVGNSLAAIKAGVVQVQGTINGYGERCGNANLCPIISALQLKMGINVVTKKQLANLKSLSHHISEIANLVPHNADPYVGHSAFTHKAGIHVSAVQKNAMTYEHIDPVLVGNERRVLVSELSGVSNLLYKARSKGIDLKKSDPATKEMLKKIKEMEHAGYQFEEGEASFELLLRKKLGKYKPLFKLISMHIVDEKHDGEEMSVEATLKLEVKGKVVHTVADGNGPVSALDRALRKALVKYYPKIKDISLADYRVRVLDSKDGTKAIVRVLIESKDAEDTWGTVGVSTNVIEASWDALVDSIEYKLG